MQIERGSDLGAQLTNFVRMSEFFIEPLYEGDHHPDIVLGVVKDLLEHIDKYSLILEAAGYNIDAFNMTTAKED